MQRSIKTAHPRRRNPSRVHALRFLAGKTATESFRLLKEVIPDQAPVVSTVCKWFRRFQTGHFSLKDDPREGRQKTATDEEMVNSVKALVAEDARITIWKIQDMLEISAGSIWKILHEDLGLSKKAAHWVPRILKDDQKEARVKSCQEFLPLFKDGKSPKFKNLVTGDETWFCNDDPETKIQSMI